jgi:hypothetical protein
MSSAWLGVASSAEGSNLVAAAFNVLGSGGQLLTSTNSGSAWASHETNRNWWAVASSADGRKLLAAVNGGQLYLSTNSGANWAATAFTNRWTTVACFWDGGRLIAAADFNGTRAREIFMSRRRSRRQRPLWRFSSPRPIPPSFPGRRHPTCGTSSRTQTSAEAAGTFSWRT